MSKDLLLVTAAFRFDNLIQIADSIKLFSNYAEIRVRWLICKDWRNGKGDLFKALKHADQRGIEWMCVNSGINEGTNYGGAMFNEALKYAKKKWYPDSDPWVYILDDDNIICPIMANQFHAMTDVADSKGKPVVWMAKLREDGFIDTIRYMFVYGTGINNKRGFPNEFMPDPSQVLMRYSYIENTLGFFEPVFEYDQALWWRFMEHMDEVTLPEEWLGIYWANRANANLWQCYHDGIMDTNDFNEFDQVVYDDSKVKDYAFLIGRDRQADRIVVPKELGPVIYDMIKNYNKDKGYVK